MKSKIIILLWLSILISSCEKITNVTQVDGITTGKLSYKLTDDSGKGLAGMNVSLYDAETMLNASSPNPAALVIKIQTDQEGIAHFTDLLPRNYLVTTESPIVNNVKYNPYEFVQVVADREKKKVVKVSDFSGTFNITLVSNLDQVTPLKNVGVVIYPMYDFRPNSDNAAEFIKTAALKGVTDENGFVAIKVPSNIAFDFIVYNLANGNLGYGYGYHSVGNGEKQLIFHTSHPF